ncbi:MAG: response regulator [Candidatus Gastranaerophilaceae bacterium]
MKKYNVLITEDHTLIRFGLKTVLESKEYINTIYEAQDALQAFDIIKQTQIDAVIMDLGLTGIDGLSATKRIKKMSPQTSIMILTSHKTADEVIESIKAGAMAYCSKEMDLENLALVLYSVLNGAIWFDPSVANYILNIIKNGNNKSNATNSVDYNLTKRELQVLAYIKEGLNNTDISKKLHLIINTIKSHVSSIMQKLEVEDRTQAAIKAISDNII